MSFFDDIDLSKVPDCGRGIAGCINHTSPDRKKINENNDKRKQESQRQLNETRRKEIQRNYIIYGLIAVGGYFAYKKFRK
jgi:hypothetical protein